MYRAIALFTAALCGVLSIILLVVPGWYVETYGVAADTGAGFMGRRVAPMMLGLAVMLWLARDAPATPLRRAMCYGLALMWAGIATTGLYEFGRSFASGTIVVAAAVELAMAACFLLAARA